MSIFGFYRKIIAFNLQLKCARHGGAAIHHYGLDAKAPLSTSITLKVLILQKHKVSRPKINNFLKPTLCTTCIHLEALYESHTGSFENILECEIGMQVHCRPREQILHYIICMLRSIQGFFIPRGLIVFLTMGGGVVNTSCLY